MSQTTIRPSEAADFDAWFDLFEQVAAEGRWIGGEAPVDRDARRDNFLGHLETDEAIRFLAESDGLLLGDISARLGGGRADLGMMVRDGYRGQGLGSALMDACLD